MTEPQLNVFLYVDSKNEGPFRFTQLKSLLDSNKITRGTLIWYEGLPSWICLGDLPEFDRRKRPRTSQPQASVPTDQYLAVIESKVTEVKKKDIAQLLLTRKIRPADLMYDVIMKRWTRADQHPELYKYFERPLLPSQVLSPISTPDFFAKWKLAIVVSIALLIGILNYISWKLSWGIFRL